MSQIGEYIECLDRHDRTLTCINLSRVQYTHVELHALLDCLVENPNVVMHIFFGNNKLTDDMGDKVARLISTTCTLSTFLDGYTKFSMKTFQSIATALHVNTSLKALSFIKRDSLSNTSIHLLFINALRINPIRPDRSTWMFSRRPLNCMDKIAEKATPPSMLEFLLYAHLTQTKVITHKKT